MVSRGLMGQKSYLAPTCCFSQANLTARQLGSYPGPLGLLKDEPCVGLRECALAGLSPH